MAIGKQMMTIGKVEILLHGFIMKGLHILAFISFVDLTLMLNIPLFYSPVKDTIVVNDRWGIGTTCKHGDYLTCSDRYNPGTLQAKKWEDAMTLDTESWGYRRDMKLSDILTIEELLQNLVRTVR